MGAREHLRVDEQPAATKFHRIQPLRVLLSGRDQRFIRVTSFLLARRGYKVVQAAPADAVGEAEHRRADVVVLESGTSRAAEARRIAGLLALGSAPGVLIVTDNGGDGGWTGFRTVEKWISLDLLVDAIESASRNRPMPIVDDLGDRR